MEKSMMEDKLAIKELVDTFSILADDKNATAQALLFTEDAEVKSYANGVLTSELKGRAQITEVFGNFLAMFETVYHINGQQVVEINENNAKGTAYCQVVLIGQIEGKKSMLTQGVRYSDEYVKVDGTWLIARRTSNFMWADNKIIE